MFYALKALVRIVFFYDCVPGISITLVYIECLEVCARLSNRLWPVLPPLLSLSYCESGCLSSYSKITRCSLIRSYFWIELLIIAEFNLVVFCL